VGFVGVYLQLAVRQHPLQLEEEEEEERDGD